MKKIDNKNKNILIKLFLDEARMLTNFNFLVSYSINTFGIVEVTKMKNFK